MYKLTPIKAVRRLLVALTNQDRIALAGLLHPDVCLEMWRGNEFDAYQTRVCIYQELLAEANQWQDETLNVRNWSVNQDSALVNFHIWLAGKHQAVCYYYTMTVSVRDDQLKSVTLFCDDPVYKACPVWLKRSMPVLEPAFF